MSFPPPKGTSDLIAPISQTWREVLSSWEDWSARYGYPLVATPLFEATELFERGVGDTSEVVTKQMYTFSDKRGRSLTLRPEGTAGVVRAYLNAGLQGQWKGAYSGPFFRYEQPQKGRSRQFWQVGVEYLGVEGPVADVEVIELAHRFLTEVGVNAMELRLNSIGDSQCRPAYVEVLRERLTAMRDGLSDDSQRLIDVNPLRVLDSKADRDRIQDVPRIVDYLCDSCRVHYEAVKAMLSGLGIGFTEDEKLVRGLDYYTRTAFEFIGTGLDAAQNALGGGGRYDGLAEAIGGHAVPGVGFALGFDRVVQAIERDRVSPLDAYLVSEVGPEPALTVASRLRSQGLRVDLDGEGRSVKAQFRSARRLEAPVILVYKGDDQPIDVQWEEGRASVGLDSVAEHLKGIT